MYFFIIMKCLLRAIERRSINIGFLSSAVRYRSVCAPAAFSNPLHRAALGRAVNNPPLGPQHTCIFLTPVVMPASQNPASEGFFPIP